MYLIPFGLTAKNENDIRYDSNYSSEQICPLVYNKSWEDKRTTAHLREVHTPINIHRLTCGELLVKFNDGSTTSEVPVM